MKRLPAFAVICLLLYPCTRIYAVTVDGRSLAAQNISPGQAGISLLAVTITNDEPPEGSTRNISRISVTYTGDAESDIAPGSARLYDETSGSRVLLQGGVSFSGGATFDGLSIALDTGAAVRLLVTADCATSVTDGHGVNAELAAGGVHASGGPPTGTFPISSLGSTPHHIVVTASRIAAGPWPAGVRAGERKGFTVRCLDAHGNLDTSWSGSTLVVEGTPGSAASSPSYEGGGPWSGSEHGQRSCAFTFFSVEAGRRVRARDTALGTDDSTPIDVTGSTGRRLNFGSIPAQTAGTPFTVKLFVTDQYGNRVTEHSGSVTTITAGDGLVASPDGDDPILPAALTWTGTEPSAEKNVSVIAFAAAAAAHLRAADSQLEGAVSPAFAVGPGSLYQYVLGGPATARLNTKTTFSVSSRDRWGNALPAYAGAAIASCTDSLALLPDRIDVTGGAGSFEVVFRTWGAHTLTVTGTPNTLVRGSKGVTVNASPAVTHFMVSAPVAVTAGKSFGATIRACDDADSVITNYSRAVTLGTASAAVIRPSSVVLSNGTWSGSLTISGETLNTSFTVTDGQITSSSAGIVQVIVPGFERARAYPTVFTPSRERLRIRYFLRENRSVRVTVYSVFMDEVRSLSFPPGSAGGAQGLNVVEWDGRGGDDGRATGHSGAYHILIDKGYEKEWVGAAIKNF